MTRTLLALTLFLAACADPFAAAQEQNTIEAYQSFLDQNPNSPFRIQAETRMAELTLEAARSAKTLEAYDAFLTKFPDSALVPKATEERRQFLWEWADREDTVQSWQKYLDEYPSGDRKLKIEARKRLNMAQNKGSIQIGEVRLEQVNLAENPDGPLDGWAFYADVTSNATQPIESLMLRLQMLGEGGEVLASQEWPAVAPHLPGRLPVEEEFKVPMKPGETRTWTWTTGDLPAGWAKKSSIAAVDIRFVGDAEGE
jgi:tetratricopeptide (TPR) repeat protein